MHFSVCVCVCVHARMCDVIVHMIYDGCVCDCAWVYG